MQKKWKKIAVLATLLTASIAFALCAHASGDLLIQAENVVAQPGETVDVAVSVSNNPGILGATLVVSYDNQLELIDAQFGSAFSPLMSTPPGKFASPCNFVWYAQSISSQDVRDGTILTLSFRVSGNASIGDVLGINLSYQDGDIFDANLSPIICKMTNGSVTVSKEGKPQISLHGAFDEEEETKALVSISSDKSIENACVLLRSYKPSGQYCASVFKYLDIQSGTQTILFTDMNKELKYQISVLKDWRPLCPECEVISETDKKILAVENVETSLGTNSVDVPILIKNNPGILGMTLKVEYDPILILSGASNGSAFSTLSYTPPGRYKNGCSFIWYAEQLKESEIQDGTILTLHFEIPSGTIKGTYPVQISYVPGDIFDYHLEEPELVIMNGGIQIK